MRREVVAQGYETAGSYPSPSPSPTSEQTFCLFGLKDCVETLRTLRVKLCAALKVYAC